MGTAMLSTIISCTYRHLSGSEILHFNRNCRYGMRSTRVIVQRRGRGRSVLASLIQNLRDSRLVLDFSFRNPFDRLAPIFAQLQRNIRALWIQKVPKKMFKQNS